jgi:biofilm PGA synthesis N-glycosyltransferase PgaC
MPGLGATTIPGELLVAVLVPAVGGVVALLLTLAATMALARRRRASKRLRALVDPVTGLWSRVRLARDLRLLSRRGDGEGKHLLAMFELAGLPAWESAHGTAAADELLRRLGRRLLNAVGRAGGAYGLERGRFGVLARVGRVSEQVIIQAATAALSEERTGAGLRASASTVTLPTGATEAGETLQWLAGLGDLRLLKVNETESHRAIATAAVAERHAGAIVSRRAGGTAGPALLERVRPTKRDRRRSHNGKVAGISGAARSAEDAPDAIATARQRDVPRRNPPPRWMPYLRVSTRFRLSVLCGISWMCLSAWLAWPWINELGSTISLPAALFLITGIALIPGYLNVQLVTSLLVDHPTPLDFDFAYPALTLLVAAYDEECDIAQTLAYALNQEYLGPLRFIVIDDGSSDETVSIARSFARLDKRVRVMEVPHGGKAEALNAGLRAAKTPLVATIDADTILMPDALRRLVARMLLSPADIVAVAGSVMVRNSRANVVTAAQTWDYFLGIGSIKRQQALLQATLVAQGAFSVYDTQALRAAGGWPDCIGEDIVLTWALLDRGGRTTYEPTAVAYTEAPVTLRSLARQRRRWARGMIEGLRTYGRALLRQRAPYVHSVAADALFPYLDLTFTLAFIPGIVLAAFGNYAIVGPVTLAVLPLNLLIAGIMYRRQRRSFEHANLRVRQNVIGFVAYLLVYQLIMSPVSLAGYVEELFHTARRW